MLPPTAAPPRPPSLLRRTRTRGPLRAPPRPEGNRGGLWRTPGGDGNDSRRPQGRPESESSDLALRQSLLEIFHARVRHLGAVELERGEILKCGEFLYARIRDLGAAQPKS